MRYFDTFAGIGGFALGIERAHESVFDAKAKCVGYSEVDKYAISIYEKHFGGHKAYGDITEINTKELPDFDILVGGFPCQAFSIAGERGGFEDTRGTLFFELARILADKKPSYFCFENVKGLLSHDRGRTFKTIIATLDELGYDLQWQVLNSKYHGVPQNRERVFIVGNLRGKPRPQIFPFGEDEELFEDNTESDTFPNKSGDNQPKMLIPEATVKGYAEAEIGDSVNLKQISSKTRRGRVGKGIANTLETGMQQHVVVERDKLAGADIRRLTPLECERLQAFPDYWTLHGKDGEGISDTQRYKTLGNAVTVSVIEDIFVKFFKSISEAHNDHHA